MTDQIVIVNKVLIKEEVDIIDYINEDYQEEEIIHEEKKEIIEEEEKEIPNQTEPIEPPIVDIDEQFTLIENLYREENGLPDYYMQLYINDSYVLHKIVPIGIGESNFFFTLSYLMFSDFRHSYFIRSEIAKHVSDNWGMFKEYAIDPVNRIPYPSGSHYYNSMLQTTTPGGGCELLAAAKVFNIRFELYIGENCSFHCGTSNSFMIRRIRVTPLRGRCHFDACIPVDTKVAEKLLLDVGRKRTVSGRKRRVSRRKQTVFERKEFIKSVEQHLLKIIFPDFQVKVDKENPARNEVILSSFTWKSGVENPKSHYGKLFLKGSEKTRDLGPIKKPTVPPLPSKDKRTYKEEYEAGKRAEENEIQKMENDIRAEYKRYWARFYRERNRAEKREIEILKERFHAEYKREWMRKYRNRSRAQRRALEVEEIRKKYRKENRRQYRERKLAEELEIKSLKTEIRDKYKRQWTDFMFEKEFSEEMASVSEAGNGSSLSKRFPGEKILETSSVGTGTPEDSCLQNEVKAADHRGSEAELHVEKQGTQKRYVALGQRQGRRQKQERTRAKKKGVIEAKDLGDVELVCPVSETEHLSCSSANRTQQEIRLGTIFGATAEENRESATQGECRRRQDYQRVCAKEKLGAEENVTLKETGSLSFSSGTRTHQEETHGIIPETAFRFVGVYNKNNNVSPAAVLVVPYRPVESPLSGGIRYENLEEVKKRKKKMECRGLYQSKLTAEELLEQKKKRREYHRQWRSKLTGEGLLKMRKRQAEFQRRYRLEKKAESIAGGKGQNVPRKKKDISNWQLKEKLERVRLEAIQLIKSIERNKELDMQQKQRGHYLRKKLRIIELELQQLQENEASGMDESGFETVFIEMKSPEMSLEDEKERHEIGPETVVIEMKSPETSSEDKNNENQLRRNALKELEMQQLKESPNESVPKTELCDIDKNCWSKRLRTETERKLQFKMQDLKHAMGGKYRNKTLYAEKKARKTKTIRVEKITRKSMTNSKI